MGCLADPHLADVLLERLAKLLAVHIGGGGPKRHEPHSKKDRGQKIRAKTAGAPPSLGPHPASLLPPSLGPSPEIPTNVEKALTHDPGMVAGWVKGH